VHVERERFRASSFGSIQSDWLEVMDLLPRRSSEWSGWSKNMQQR
jgi:hypothetical protein